MYLNENLKEKIKDTLLKGGVIVYVTDTVWGLGALPSNKDGINKIYDIKRREAKKPLILMSNNIKNLVPYVKSIDGKAEELIKKYFPGALTLVLEKSDKTPDYITSGFNTVGIRVPDNEVFKEICDAAPGRVIATTSANLSDEPSAITYKQAVITMKDKADLIIQDYGQTAKGIESTVALISRNEVKILRQGAVKLD